MTSLQHYVFFDPPTFTLTYVVWDRVTRDAVIIDPVMDFDPATQWVSEASLARLLRFVAAEDLRVGWVLDTHVHADHLSAARQMRQRGVVSEWAMSERLSEVFATFKKLFGWPKGLELSALGVDRWLRDGEELCAGSLRIEAVATPGHTPACLTFRVGEWLFTGDALFMPDSGVGRCDFPGGSASALYDSVWGRLYGFPDHFQTFTGHDYQPGGRPMLYRCALAEQKQFNLHLRLSTSREEFVRLREARDKTLSAPRLLNPSLDWNLGANLLAKPSPNR